MNEIPNTEYITINTRGIFVGGQRAEHYRGVTITESVSAFYLFKKIQLLNPEIAELQVLSSDEFIGNYKSTNKTPSYNPGSVAWCRLITKDGRASKWVCFYDYDIPHRCARRCAYDCAENIYDCPKLRFPLFESIRKQKPKKQPVEEKPKKRACCQKILDFFKKQFTDFQHPGK